MVLKHMQLVTGYILRYEDRFRSVMESQLRVESAEKLNISKGRLERNEKRIAELKRLFIKIYEDNARGKLNDERFDMLSQSYEAEQKQLEAEAVQLKQEMKYSSGRTRALKSSFRKPKAMWGWRSLTRML